MVEQVLSELHKKYGDEAVFNPKKLRALLLDMRVPKKTVNLLTDISRIEYFKQFANEITDDISARDRLVFNTENEYAFDRRAIEYGVDCWVCVFAGNAVTVTELTVTDGPESTRDDVWPDETAALVATALRELMRE